MESEDSREKSLINDLRDWVQNCKIKDSKEILDALAKALYQNNPIVIQEKTKELSKIIFESFYIALVSNFESVPKLIRAIIEIAYNNRIHFVMNQKLFREAFELVEFSFIDLTELEIIATRLSLIELCAFFEDEWANDFLLEILLAEKHHDVIKEAVSHSINERCQEVRFSVKEASRALAKKIKFVKKDEYKDQMEEYMRTVNQNCRILKLLGDLGVKSIVPDLGYLVTQRKSELEHYWLSDTIARILLPPVKKKKTKSFVRRAFEAIPLQLLVYVIVLTGIILFKAFKIDERIYIKFVASNTLLTIIVVGITLWQIISARAILSTIASVMRYLGIGFSMLFTPITNTGLRVLKKTKIKEEKIGEYQFWARGDFGRKILKSLLRIFAVTIACYIIIYVVIKIVLNFVPAFNSINFGSSGWLFQFEDIFSLSIQTIVWWIVKLLFVVVGTIEALLNIFQFHSLRKYPLFGRKPSDNRSKRIISLIIVIIFALPIVGLDVISRQLLIYNVLASDFIGVVFALASIVFAVIVLISIRRIKVKIPIEIYEKSEDRKTIEEIDEKSKFRIELTIRGEFSQRFGFSWIPIYISTSRQLLGRSFEFDYKADIFRKVPADTGINFGLIRKQGELVGIYRLHKHEEAKPGFVECLKPLRDIYEIEERPTAKFKLQRGFQSKNELPSVIYLVASSYGPDSKLDFTFQVYKDGEEIKEAKREILSRKLFFGDWWYSNTKDFKEIHAEFRFRVLKEEKKPKNKKEKGTNS